MLELPGWLIGLHLSTRLVSTIQLANFQIKSDGSFVSLAGLKLHGVAFVKVLNLGSGSEAAAMKKYVFAAIIGSDEPKPFLAHDLLNRSRHMKFLF